MSKNNQTRAIQYFENGICVAFLHVIAATNEDAKNKADALRAQGINFNKPNR